MTKKSSNDRHRYEDIIHLPHHVSGVHPQMTQRDRAAQFSPFAALTGYEDALEEAGRHTGERIELDEDAKNILDEKLRMIQEQITVRPQVQITYFVPDEKKTGGAYTVAEGWVKKIDRYGQNIIMDDGRTIPVGEIIEIRI
ncbi:MAG: hypothetical protein K2O16_18765 [Lachnospiraceae bacterium]|nr:hypothetical protein [Lachnospiraceae bacterium]